MPRFGHCLSGQSGISVEETAFVTLVWWADL